MAKIKNYNSLKEIPIEYKEIYNNYGKPLIKGTKFNELEVVYRTISDSSRSSQYVCKCSCGKYCIVSRSNLIRGNTKSCGHLRGHDYEDLTNQHFGKLIAKFVIKKNERYYWICECECGSTVEIKASHLKDESIQSCGCIKSIGEEKISKILKENNVNFIKQFHFDTSYFKETNRPMVFDFYVNNSYIIEYDGIQHFNYKNDNGWNNKENFIKTQKRDREKNQWCFNNNIPIIRIPYSQLKNLSINDLLLTTSNFILKRRDK